MKSTTIGENERRARGQDEIVPRDKLTGEHSAKPSVYAPIQGDFGADDLSSGFPSRLLK
jgi:hypothetical protein